MSYIRKFNNWKASSLLEQTVTDYDATYDYKKEGDKYYTKKKGTQYWS